MTIRGSISLILKNLNETNKHLIENIEQAHIEQEHIEQEKIEKKGKTNDNKEDKKHVNKREIMLEKQRQIYQQLGKITIKEQSRRFPRVMGIKSIELSTYSHLKQDINSQISNQTTPS